jgi:hypothetical protein
MLTVSIQQLKNKNIFLQGTAMAINPQFVK